MTAWRSFWTGFWVTVGACVAVSIFWILTFVATTVGLVSLGSFVGGAVEQAEKLERETDETAVRVYGDKIRIDDIEAKREHNDAVWVTAKIKNLGDRAVGSLTFTIYFRDSSGVAIFEADNRTASDGVIRPSYIQKFMAYVEDVPDEWSEGNVDLKLTGIEFADE